MIISPFSTAMALTLFMQGTNGKTLEELQKGLHFNSIDKASIADQFQQYYELLKKGAGKSELLVANRIYVQQGYTINPDFQEVATKKFFSGVESVNFGEANDAKRKINQFVEEKTKGRIKEIATPITFTGLSVIFILNSIYLKSERAEPFPKPTGRRANPKGELNPWA